MFAATVSLFFSECGGLTGWSCFQRKSSHLKTYLIEIFKKLEKQKFVSDAWDDTTSICPRRLPLIQGNRGLCYLSCREVLESLSQEVFKIRVDMALRVTKAML